jgi:hypothetical protein
MYKNTVLYAVPCAFSDEELDYELEDLFFVTFATRDEQEALKLASCICGKQAKKSLVMISESGEIYYI